MEPQPPQLLPPGRMAPLWEAASDPGGDAVRALCERAGGVGGLCALLASADPAAQRQAAFALRNLAAADDAARQGFAAADGLLLRASGLLSSPCGGTAEQAAWLLSNLARSPLLCGRIAETMGCIDALTPLLRGVRGGGAAKRAARALVYLAAGVGPRPRAELVAALLDNGARAEALFWACRKGLLAVTEALLPVDPPRGPAVLEALAARKHCALRAASSGGHADVVAKLLELYGASGGAAVLEALRAAPRPLPLAAQHCGGDPRGVLRLLLRAYRPPGPGGEQEESDQLRVDRRVALSAACGAGRLAAIKALLEDMEASDRSAELWSLGLLRRAAADGAADIVSYLLAVLVTDGSGTARRALQWDNHGVLRAAADGGHAAAVEALRSYYLAGHGGGWAEAMQLLLPATARDSPAALLFVCDEAAWRAAGEGGAAGVLLSPERRRRLALAAFLAVRSLPAGAAEAMATFLRARPWLAYGARLP
jgi:hypothetical protein